MEDADDTLPRSVISASRAAAAHQKPPVAPALADQVTEASERFSVPTAEPARSIPLVTLALALALGRSRSRSRSRLFRKLSLTLTLISEALTQAHALAHFESSRSRSH
jgi:hypothetical protein